MTKKPLPSLASVPVTAPIEPSPASLPTPLAPIAFVPRESLHVRIPVQTAERIREAAFRLRRDKQDITDEALREWLVRAGY